MFSRFHVANKSGQSNFALNEINVNNQISPSHGGTHGGPGPFPVSYSVTWDHTSVSDK